MIWAHKSAPPNILKVLVTVTQFIFDPRPQISLPTHKNPAVNALAKNKNLWAKFFRQNFFGGRLLATTSKAISKKRIYSHLNVLLNFLGIERHCLKNYSCRLLCSAPITLSHFSTGPLLNCSMAVKFDKMYLVWKDNNLSRVPCKMYKPS